MADITKLPILTSASDGTYLLTVDNDVAKRLPFPGAGQLRGNIGYTGSFGYTGSRGPASTIPGYVGSKGYTGSTGYVGSSGAAVHQGYTGSQGIQGIPGPGTVLNASTLSVFTTASLAVEYFVGVPVSGSDQTPIISTAIPVIFNTTLGQVGVGTTATQGTLHLKSSTSTQIFLEVTNTSTKHQIYSSPAGNLNIDVDTFNAAGGSNFYISQAGAHKITIVPNGNVGIVTDEPSDTLDVSGILRVSSNNTISKSYGRFYPQDDSRVYLENQRYAAATSTPDNILYGGTRIVGDIDHPEIGGVFSFDNTYVGHLESQVWRQRMTIIENGNVGINVPRPNTLLTVNSNLTTTNVVPYSSATVQMIGADGFSNRLMMNSFGVTTNANVIGAISAGGTATTPTPTASGSSLLNLVAGGRGDTRDLPELAGIRLVSSGSRDSTGTHALYTDIAAGSQMEFYTSELNSTATSLRLWISHTGRIISGGGTFSGYSDLNIRQAGTVGRAGSLSLTGMPMEGSNGTGTSYVLMGNANGAGALGPVIVRSFDRRFQIGTGTDFTTSTGGTFFRNFDIDVDGNGDIYGNWTIDGGVAPSATMATLKPTFYLVNNTATTVYFAGSATILDVGASTGTMTINNPTVVGINSTQYLWNTSATTVYFAGSATTLDVGANTGTMTINNPTVVGINPTQRLWDTSATTVYFAGSATTLDVGANTGTMTINNPTVVGINPTQYLWNTSATTVYFAGSATTLDVGANTGTMTINNPTVVGINPTQYLWNTSATTVYFASSATSLNMGATSGIATLANPTLVGTQPTQYVYNTVASTVYAFGAGTDVNLSANSGTTTIHNQLIVNGGSDATASTTTVNTQAFQVSANGLGVIGDSKFNDSLDVGNNLWVDNNLDVGGGNITTPANVSTFNIINEHATTVNAFGAATTLKLGSALPGTTTVRNDLVVTGSLTVQGPTTYSESTNTVISDNIIELHSMPTGVGSPWTVDDGKDIGLRFHYYRNGDKNAALVLANDTGYLEWYDSGAEQGPVFNGTYGTFKAGNMVLSGLIPGQIVYPNANAQFTGTNKLFWDATNSRLGIGNNIPSYDLDVTGDIRATGVIYAQTQYNQGKYLQGGDDAAFYDVNTPNTTAIKGVQDPTVGSLQLGTGTAIISGKSSYIGIGNINPSYALDVAGDIHTTSTVYCNTLHNGYLVMAGTGGKLQDSGLMFNGIALSGLISPNNLTANRVTYYDGSKLSDSGNLTFDGSFLTAANVINGTISSFSQSHHYRSSRRY